MRFELHIDGTIFRSDDFDYLKKITLKSKDEYVIYQLFQSKIYAVPYPVEITHKINKPIKRQNSNGTKLLSYEEAERISGMHRRGFPITKIAKQFHVSNDKVSVSLLRYQLSDSKEEYSSKPIVSLKLSNEK